MEIKDFDKDVLKNKEICVVDFWAPWCGPCKMFGPIFESVEKEVTDKKFYKVNVDENEEICKQYGVMSIPTTIIFKDGKEIKKNVGFMDEDSFKEFVNNI